MSRRRHDVRRKESRWGALSKGKVAVFLAAVIGGALTATFTDGFQDLFGGLLPNGWTEPGSAIKVVDVRRQPMSGRVLIPGADDARFDSLDDANDSINDPEWEAEHEWYASGYITWEVTLLGRHKDTVVITDMRPERTGSCTERRAAGTLVEDLTQGEGKKIDMTAAIDARAPQLTSTDGGSAYFDDGTVTLAKGETVVVSVRATSAGPTCRWVLEADYVDHGKRKTMTIKAPGDKPFTITGWADGHAYESTWNIRCNRAMTPAESASYDAPTDCNW